MPIEVYAEPEFRVLYNLPDNIDTILCIGGRGGKKTYEVSKFIAKSAAIDKKRCVILRDEKALIKETILNEILTRYDTANSTGALSGTCERLATGLKDRTTGKDLVFTKGFKASDNTKKANMKGASDIDIAVVEEAEDIIDKEKFDTFVDSLRKEGCVVIIMMNVPDIGHFLVKRYFNTETTEHDGYFKLRPRNIPGFLCIQTDYTHNPHLPTHIINRYKSYGDPLSHMYNLHYYLTAILGLSSTGRKGQILRKVKPISLIEYMALPFKEIYGQDFGTASPAGMVGVKFDKNNCYVRQLNYLPMNTLEIGKLYCTFGFGPVDRIIADSADKDACDKLSGGWTGRELDNDTILKYPGLRRGFNVIKCVKGEGSITAGISIMDGLSLFAVEESVELWDEIRQYVYAVDKYNNYTNEPIDDKNHLIDPWRYVCVDQRGKKEFFGI